MLVLQKELKSIPFHVQMEPNYWETQQCPTCSEVLHKHKRLFSTTNVSSQA